MSDFLVQDGQTFLFQGDSITDCGRRDETPPLGGGYAALVREMAIALRPDREINFLNRGISGNTTKDLRERWQDDMIELQPDWLSILIGINDHHRYLFNPDPNVKVSPSEFHENYDWLLARTTKETHAKIVILEPFYISLSSRDTQRKAALDLLPEYIHVARAMSAKYNTLLVKMHDIFQHHLTFREAECFCPEPVHPNRTGHVVIATELLRTLGAL